VDATGSITVLSCIYVPPQVVTAQIWKYTNHLYPCNHAHGKAAMENKAGTTSQTTPLVKKPRVSTSPVTRKLIMGSEKTASNDPRPGRENDGDNDGINRSSYTSMRAVDPIRNDNQQMKINSDPLSTL
jgi:hypothetical protein